MKRKQNNLIQYNIMAIIMVIINQFAQSHAMVLPSFFENIHLISWEGLYNSSVQDPIVPDCMNSTICDSVKSYPTNLVTILMEKLRSDGITKHTNDFFNDTENSQLEELCTARKEKIMFPLAARMHLSGKWQYILNKKEVRFQSFRVHECLDTSKLSCSQVVKVSYPYTLQCEQRFTKRSMVYLNLERKAVEIGYFPVPTCCSCYLESIF